jgi:hypothetical protein
MQRPDGLCSSDHRLPTNIFFECFIVKTANNAASRSGLGFCVLGGEYATTIELMRLTDLASIKGDSSNPACHFRANFLSQTLGGRCPLSGNFEQDSFSLRRLTDPDRNRLGGLGMRLQGKRSSRPRHCFLVKQ